MSEPNWIARIIVLMLVLLVIGILGLGYYEGNKPPQQQPITQAVSDDRLP